MFIETSSKKQLSQEDEVSSMSLGKSVFAQMFILYLAYSDLSFPLLVYESANMIFEKGIFCLHSLLVVEVMTSCIHKSTKLKLHT